MRGPYRVSIVPPYGVYPTPRSTAFPMMEPPPRSGTWEWHVSSRECVAVSEKAHIKPDMFPQIVLLQVVMH